MNIIDRLYNEIKDKGPICVGLDPRDNLFPEYLQKSNITIEEKIYEFNKKIIDETKEFVACYKPQIACYEAYGLKGLIAYKKTVEYIRGAGKIAIGDIKRGDISSTAEMYAQGHFTGDFEVDFITVNPYMGQDAISPYYSYLKSGEKGLFVLVKTSNKSSEDFQELKIQEKPLYIKVAEKLEQWGSEFVGECGYSSLGGVIGLTYPEEFIEIKKVAPKTFFLIPGYGKQGGTGKDVAKVLGKEMCGVVNSSRGIIGAHKGIDESETFAKYAKEAVLNMREDIMQWLR